MCNTEDWNDDELFASSKERSENDCEKHWKKMQSIGFRIFRFEPNSFENFKDRKKCFCMEQQQQQKTPPAKFSTNCPSWVSFWLPTWFELRMDLA